MPRFSPAPLNRKLFSLSRFLSILLSHFFVERKHTPEAASRRTPPPPGRPLPAFPVQCGMKKKIPFKRSHFLYAFSAIVAGLSITKCVNPDISLPRLLTGKEDAGSVKIPPHAPDSIELQAMKVDSLLLRPRSKLTLLRRDGKPVKNRVTSVVRFEDSFPDLNDVQLATAMRMGIAGIANREEAQRHLKDLVFIGDNPFYSVQPLRQSIPYLVPRAATLLNEIARAFNDSLVTKGYPPHKLLITSVLRTKEDVEWLRRFNQNASENSCHQHGTTFDISYNRFLEIEEDGESDIRWVTAFKSILAEVLEDQRLMGTCYVKFEVHQSCFHITAR